MRRRRMMMQEHEQEVSGNAISATTSIYFVTPITRPSNATLLFDCLIEPLNSGLFSGSQPFFDLTDSKTDMRRQSNNTKLEYRYYGNNFGVAVEVGSNRIKAFAVYSRNGYFTVTLEDDTVITSETKGAFPAKTNNLRLVLKPGICFKRVRQLDANNNIVHDITATEQNGVVGMIDAVTGTFYPDTSGNAYLTTI